MDTPPPERRSRNWIPILALIASVGSLGVSISSVFISSSYYRAVTTHNKLLVKPYVSVYVALAGPGRKNGIYMANHGLGPGFIKKLWVQGGGRTYDGFDRNLWQNIIKDLNSWKNYNLSSTCYKEVFIQPDSIITAGQNEPIFSPTDAKIAQCDIELLRFLEAFHERGLKIYVHYESIYNDVYESIAESWFDQEKLDQLMKSGKGGLPLNPLAPRQ